MLAAAGPLSPATRATTLAPASAAAAATVTAALAPPSGARVTLVVERPTCGVPSPAAGPAGTTIVVVCGREDALGAVLAAASAGAPIVYGRGPDVRAALTEVAADHPTTRFVPLGGGG